jgi:hypothetical protein
MYIEDYANRDMTPFPTNHPIQYCIISIMNRSEEKLNK